MTQKLSLIAGIFFMSLFSFAQGNYAIRNVSVITMTNENVLPNQTVVVEKGIIKSIGPAATTRVGNGVTVYDGTGKFLMPGLFDMHAHFFQEQGDNVNTNETDLILMLINGVTTARIMSGHPDFLAARANVKSGKWKGPELSVASPQLAGQWPFPPEFKNYELVTTEAQAAQAVAKFKREGYDAIKITFKITKPVYKAIIDAAKRENIKVVGHVGPYVMLPTALEAKQPIEHMDMFIEMLLPDTTYNHGQSVSDFNIYSKAAWETVPHVMESKIPALAKSVKEAGVYVTPTNYFFISNAGIPMTDEEIRNKPDYDFIPSKLKEEKWMARNSYLKKMAPLESREKYVRVRKQMVNELWKAGVPLMAGSDAPEYFQVVGFALHDELRLMVEAGLTPFAALETATTIPATFLGINNRTGTIEVGKEADLVLLNENPLANINNTRNISGVGTSNYWLTEDELRKLREHAKKILGE